MFASGRDFFSLGLVAYSAGKSLYTSLAAGSFGRDFAVIPLMLARGSNYFGLSLAAAFASAGIGLNTIIAAVRFGGDFTLVPSMAKSRGSVGHGVAALGAYAAHQALGFASGLLALSIFSASMIASDGLSSLMVRQTGDRKRDQQSRDHEYAKKFLHVRCSSQYILLVHIAIAADCYSNTLPISEGKYDK